MLSFFKKKSPVLPFYDNTPRMQFNSINAVWPASEELFETVIVVNPIYEPGNYPPTTEPNPPSTPSGPGFDNKAFEK